MNWIKQMFARRRLYRDLSEEIRQHLEEKADELVESGMSREEAMAAARREFGNVTSVEERGREPWRWPRIESVFFDVRYAFRQLRRQPLFTGVAVLILGLGIGATTAVFSVVDAVLLRPLPYPDPERLVWVTSQARSFPDQPEVALLADFVEWRERAKSFSHIATFWTGESNFADQEGAQRIANARVTADFLAMLGVRPALGRDFVRAEEEPGHGHVVVLSHAFWQQRFGADENVMGREIMLDGESYTVVGVLPQSFVFPLASALEIKLLRPMGFDIERERQRQMMRFQFVAARLAPDVSAESARGELDVIRAWIDEQAPRMKEWGLATVVRPLREQLVGATRPALLILFGAVGCVLWIACFNVANLLLAKGSGRRREMAIRGALGAGRRRLARQLLTESVLLATGGCVAGVGLSVILRHGLAAIRPEALYHSEISGLNMSVLLFAILLSALTAIACGIAPAFTASRLTPIVVLKTGVAHISAARDRRRLLNTLVVGQLTLALVLLVASGLMVQSFQRLRFQNLGFRTEGVLTTSLSLDPTRYDPSQQQAFFAEILERAHAMPGVEEAALAAGLPPSSGAFCEVVYAEGPIPPENVSETPCVRHQGVSPAYFSALEIPLLQGRLFSDEEAPSDNVSIVSAAFARTYFGAADPIGKRFRPPRGDPPWRTVIGVVADTRGRGMRRQPEPHVYIPFHNQPTTVGSLVLTTPGSVGALGSALRDLIHEIDPLQAMAEIETLDQRLTREVSRERFLTWVLTAFACLAVTLAAIGVYGVVAYMMQQRRQEIGVRLALGAQPGDILQRVLAHGLKLMAVGIALGLVGAIAVTRVLESYLFEISATDWRTFAFAAMTLAVVAILACYGPARRASRTDPLNALRHE